MSQTPPQVEEAFSMLNIPAKKEPTVTVVTVQNLEENDVQVSIFWEEDKALEFIGGVIADCVKDYREDNPGDIIWCDKLEGFLKEKKYESATDNFNNYYPNMFVDFTTQVPKL